MLITPQENGDRVQIPNRSDFRLALEAFNFHPEEINPQTIIMRRLGPDAVVFQGQQKVRERLTADFISQLQREMRLV
jgi:hypothetical protein